MMNSKNIQNLFWFRRDLRLADNHALAKALANGSTLCCFIWDRAIIDKLEKDNLRVAFIEQSLNELKTKLQNAGSDLIICLGNPQEELTNLINQYGISKLYFNEDYEPWAISRDKKIIESLKSDCHTSSFTYKDQVVFHKNEILNKENRPYHVYSAYKKAWLSRLVESDYINHPSNELLNNLAKIFPQQSFYQPSQDGFNAKLTLLAGEDAANDRLNKFLKNIDEYHLTRNFPDVDSTSYLGVDLRFGTISIRQLVRLALTRQSEGAETWLSELIWRDFFSQILYNYPYVVNSAFNRKYTNLAYENNQEMFQKWCDGQTGYPIVDAAMRQLNQTGFMHNRLRMIVASFLCKDLLIDWRWGEQYFSKRLLDYDLASNNGNWQWCASTGCDAQPYFRIFNPLLQSKKFDESGNFIRKYVPELSSLDNKQIHEPIIDIFSEINYPMPIVIHKEQAQKAIAMFKG